MRFLRRQTLNRRSVYDNALYVDTTDAIVMGSQNNLLLPSGPTGTRPAVPVNGMIRYNTTSNDVEVYQGNTWRPLRYRESGAITQQTLGIGDGVSVFYGALSPAPAPAASGYTWTGSNLLVLIENVVQLYNTNYTVIQNPTFPITSYTGETSVNAVIGSTTIFVNSAVQSTAASGTGTTVTISFATAPAAPFGIGDTITVAGIVPYEYNGAFVVTGVTASSVSYVHTATGAQTTAGTVTSDSVIYPTVSITGAAITGSSNVTGRTVTGYTVNAETGALQSITLSAPTGVTVNNAVVIITTATQVGSGYFLEFSSAVPEGKAVTVLHGFDQ